VILRTTGEVRRFGAGNGAASLVRSAAEREAAAWHAGSLHEGTPLTLNSGRIAAPGVTVFFAGAIPGH
jgi:hypothetical protein